MDTTKLDHIGWITNNTPLFEKFWVGVLGFKKVWESRLTPELAKTLFDVDYGATCRRYEKNGTVIETHQFDKPTKKEDSHFVRYGINHIALHVESRKEFLKQYKFDTKIYHNPGGWDNIFIRDFEGNWVELKETFK